MGQEECPLLLTKEYHCLDRQQDNKEKNTPLLTINNERINQRDIFGEEMAGIGQVDMGEMTMRYGEEEAARLMEEIIKNNETIIRIQKQLEGLLVEVENKRWQEDREIERRREREQEEMDKWMEECRKRNEKEKEEKEERRRVDEE